MESGFLYFIGHKHIIYSSITYVLCAYESPSTITHMQCLVKACISTYVHDKYEYVCAWQETELAMHHSCKPVLRETHSSSGKHCAYGLLWRGENGAKTKWERKRRKRRKRRRKRNKRKKACSQLCSHVRVVVY